MTARPLLRNQPVTATGLLPSQDLMEVIQRLVKDGIDLSAALQADLTTSRVKLQTAVTAAGQTEIPFTGIPAWANRVTVTFAGFSTNGTSEIAVQLGDSGGIETTGYTTTVLGALGVAVAHQNYTAGFAWVPGAATDTASGSITLSRQSGNLWVADGKVKRATNSTAFIMGDKTLSDVLTQVRITTVGGVNTFDAGSVAVSWE